mmetsp:Transcript_30065/g.71530  ORF Transcript_30065/g.71530 Transcript_30065/m.71530 type:complete len:234 (-) Transcript_30065:830-1531(-)
MIEDIHRDQLQHRQQAIDQVHVRLRLPQAPGLKGSEQRAQHDGDACAGTQPNHGDGVDSDQLLEQDGHGIFYDDGDIPGLNAPRPPLVEHNSLVGSLHGEEVPSKDGRHEAVANHEVVEGVDDLEHEEQLDAIKNPEKQPNWQDQETWLQEKLPEELLPRPFLVGLHEQHGQQRDPAEHEATDCPASEDLRLLILHGDTGEPREVLWSWSFGSHRGRRGSPSVGWLSISSEHT